MATILFCDMVSCTTLVSTMPPEHVVAMMNAIDSKYDLPCGKEEVYKVETIGDAFIAVPGAPNEEDQSRALIRVAHLALRTVEEIN